MTIIILLLLLSYGLIATGHITGLNKAAIAMLLCAAGWVVYVSYGADFVTTLYAADYLDYLEGRPGSSTAVKEFICTNIFLKHVGRAAGVVMFLLATMTIVEILRSNGCFDFIMEWLRTRSTKRFLWGITTAAFIISANLDNLTTTVMLLVVMHSLVRSRRQRMLIGSAVVVAANVGGCFTVIGDTTGLVLWQEEAVSATAFSRRLFLPALAAWGVSTWLIGRMLPPRLDLEFMAPPYRGNDTRLTRWQRFLMLVVGIGGLWFIPTFHNITKLPPFLGALCVLSVLWVVNELVNRRLLQADQTSQRRLPLALEYGSMQQLLFIMGIMLGLGVAGETGIFGSIASWLDNTFHSIWVTGLFAALLSSVVDSFTMAYTGISLYPVAENISLSGHYLENFTFNGIYWSLIAFATAVGGSLLCIGSVSGLALKKMEHIHVGWYLRNISPKILLGLLSGLLILYAESFIA